MIRSFGVVDVTIIGGIAIALLLFLFGTFTIGYAAYASRRDRRISSSRPEVRDGLLGRMGEEDPDWEAWGATLSTVEREASVELLDEHLRQLRGSSKEQLIRAADALDLDEEAMDDLRKGGRIDKLTALTWLTLLDGSVDVGLLRESCLGDRDLRASAARLLYDRHSPGSRAAGNAFLLFDPEDALSVFGLDTLYRLNQRDPTNLLLQAEQLGEEWRPSLRIQVMYVIGRAAPVGADVSLEWILRQLAAESPEVREAAVRALRQYGWRQDVRSGIDLPALIADPSPNVRQAVCGLLGTWGDPDALDALIDMLRDDSDDRVRLQAARRLHAKAPDRIDSEALPSSAADTWAWVRAANLDKERAT